MNSFRVLSTRVVSLCSDLASKQAEPHRNGHLNVRAEESSPSFHVMHFSPQKQTRSVKTPTDTFGGSSKDDLHQGSTCFSTIHRGRKATLPVTTRTACRPPPPREAGMSNTAGTLCYLRLPTLTPGQKTPITPD